MARENTDEIVHRYLQDDLALYSLHMPGNVETASIMVTDREILQTYFYVIEKDDVALACISHLQRAGAPVFKSAKVQGVYAAELEGQLRRGLTPADARDAALRKLRAGQYRHRVDRLMRKAQARRSNGKRQRSLIEAER